VAEHVIPRDHGLRPLYVYDGPSGSDGRALNMTVRHGVRSSLALKDTHDPEVARRLSNPEVGPHLAFTDLGGHGYATVRVSAAELETEFVCIPRPVERDAGTDGGPLAYRVQHRVPLWKAGEHPRLEQQLFEGEMPLGN
jgi:alkaline phosphatase D